MNPDEIILSIIPAFDVTLLEYNVMYSLYLTAGGLPRNRLTRHVQRLVDFYRDIPSEVYDETIDTCLRKQWIKVLTAEDCARDRERWKDEENQYISEAEYIEGNVDFTSQGAGLWDAMEAQIGPAFGRRLYSGVGYACRFPQQIRFLGAYWDDVLQGVEEARLQPKLMWVSDDDRLRMDRIGEPQKIGPWWRNRFVRLPEGYRIDVDYTLVPKQNRKRKRG